MRGRHLTFVLTLLVRASDDLEEHHNDPNRIEYFLPNLFAFDELSYAPEIKFLLPVTINVKYGLVKILGEVELGLLSTSTSLPPLILRS